MQAAKKLILASALALIALIAALHAPVLEMLRFGG